MSIHREELLAYCHQTLSVNAFKDYCPNGLQVEGKANIHRLVTGVTASQALIDAAIKAKADAILVHHGYFWRGEAAPLVGVKAKRIKSLLQHDINLFAYHLPLDAHPSLGNNAQLAKRLGFSVSGGLDDSQHPIGLSGEPRGGKGTLSALADDIHTELAREPLVIGDRDRLISKVAWCTGAAQSMIETAFAAGAECFISGEISEQTVHLAKELGIAYVSAGHHATERYGAMALGEHLSRQFGLAVEFIDIDNPV